MVLEIGLEELGKVYSKLFEKSIKDNKFKSSSNESAWI